MNELEDLKLKTLIKKIVKTNSEGVCFELTQEASLVSLKSKIWWVSWDKIGKVLFKDQYSDKTSVKELQTEREAESEDQ